MAPVLKSLEIRRNWGWYLFLLIVSIPAAFWIYVGLKSRDELSSYATLVQAYVAGSLVFATIASIIISLRQDEKSSRQISLSQQQITLAQQQISFETNHDIALTCSHDGEITITNLSKGVIYLDEFSYYDSTNDGYGEFNLKDRSVNSGEELKLNGSVSFISSPKAIEQLTQYVTLQNNDPLHSDFSTIQAGGSITIRYRFSGRSQYEYIRSHNIKVFGTWNEGQRSSTIWRLQVIEVDAQYQEVPRPPLRYGPPPNNTLGFISPALLSYKGLSLELMQAYQNYLGDESAQMMLNRNQLADYLKNRPREKQAVWQVWSSILTNEYKYTNGQIRYVERWLEEVFLQSSNGHST